MATTKRFTLAATTATFPVLVVRRGSDGYVRDDLDGDWKAPVAATTPYLAMAEDATLTGLFAAAITGEVWQDDTYTALFYASSAMDAAPVQTITKAIHGDYAADPGGAVSLVEYALCTLQQVKSALGYATGFTAEDDRISTAINSATDRIETITNRKLMKRAAASAEYHDGGETTKDDAYCVIWPLEYPVESIADVTSIQTHMSLDAPTTIDLDNVAVDRQRVLVFMSDTIPEGIRETLLTYRPGYSVTPHDINGVAINLVQRLYWKAKRIEAGDSEEGAGGTTRREKIEAFSAEDQLVLDEYTRVQAGDWKRGQAKRMREWVR